MTERERQELRAQLDRARRDRRAAAHRRVAVADDEIPGEVRRYGRRRFVFRELAK